MHLAVGLSHRLESTTVHSAGVIAPTGVRGAGSCAIRGSPGAAGWREGDCRSARPRLGGARILLHPKGEPPVTGCYP